MILKWNNFQRGQCSSPYTDDGAFSRSQNMDVFGLPGIARINYLPTKQSTTVTGVPTTFVRDYGSLQKVYAVDHNAAVYYSADAGATWTKISDATDKGYNIVFWRGYLIAAEGANLKSYDATNGWVSLSTGLDSTTTDGVNKERHMFVSQNDGKVYICNHNKIATLTEDTTFDPTSGATFTVTTDAVTLPAGWYARCLTEQRKDLLIGALFGSVSSDLSTIFLWNRSSQEMDYPVSPFDGEVKCLFVKANRVFVTTQSGRGDITLFSEAGLTPYSYIPIDRDGSDDVFIGFYGHNDLTWWNGRLVTGVTYGTGTQTSAGVYSFYDKKANHETLISTGETGSNNAVTVDGVFALDKDTLLIGWKDDDAYGIDRILVSGKRWTGYTSFMESPIWRAGTKLNPVNFSQVEIQLARALQTGEGLKLYYRTSIDASWTEIGTLDYTTQGAVSSFVFPYGINGVENVQLKVTMTTGASSSNTPYLYSIELQ